MKQYDLFEKLVKNAVSSYSCNDKSGLEHAVKEFNIEYEHLFVAKTNNEEISFSVPAFKENFLKLHNANATNFYRIEEELTPIEGTEEKIAYTKFTIRNKEFADQPLEKMLLPIMKDYFSVLDD